MAYAAGSSDPYFFNPMLSLMQGYGGVRDIINSDQKAQDQHALAQATLAAEQRKSDTEAAGKAFASWWADSIDPKTGEYAADRGAGAALANPLMNQEIAKRLPGMPAGAKITAITPVSDDGNTLAVHYQEPSDAQHKLYAKGDGPHDQVVTVDKRNLTTYAMGVGAANNPELFKVMQEGLQKYGNIDETAKFLSGAGKRSGADSAAQPGMTVIPSPATPALPGLPATGAPDAALTAPPPPPAVAAPATPDSLSAALDGPPRPVASNPTSATAGPVMVDDYGRPLDGASTPGSLNLNLKTPAWLDRIASLTPQLQATVNTPPDAYTLATGTGTLASGVKNWLTEKEQQDAALNQGGPMVSTPAPAAAPAPVPALMADRGDEPPIPAAPAAVPTPNSKAVLPPITGPAIANTKPTMADVRTRSTEVKQAMNVPALKAHGASDAEIETLSRQLARQVEHKTITLQKAQDMIEEAAGKQVVSHWVDLNDRVVGVTKDNVPIISMGKGVAPNTVYSEDAANQRAAYSADRADRRMLARAGLANTKAARDDLKAKQDAQTSYQDKLVADQPSKYRTAQGSQLMRSQVAEAADRFNLDFRKPSNQAVVDQALLNREAFIKSNQHFYGDKYKESDIPLLSPFIAAQQLAPGSADPYTDSKMPELARNVELARSKGANVNENDIIDAMVKGARAGIPPSEVVDMTHRALARDPSAFQGLSAGQIAQHLWIAHQKNNQ